MNILALEVSTSSAKAVLYSSGEGILGTRDHQYKEAISNVITQDAEGVYQAVLECGKSLVESLGCNVDGIGLSSTWHSLLCLDSDRKPVGPTITWANTMAADTVNKYRQDEKLGKWIYQLAGCPIHSMYPLWKWLHMRENGMIEKPENLFLASQPEYIFERLTGEIGVSRSVASGTGFMNIHTLEWDKKILEMAGVSEEQLAPLREPEYTAPLSKEAADYLGLSSGIPVVITGPDGALNQIGAGALKEGIMTLSIGTSGALRIANSQPVLPENPSTWCYYVAQGKRLAGAATSGAGNCVDWFVRTLNRGVMDYSAFDRLMDEVDSGESPIFLPFLYGERSPGWEDARTGGFQGLKGHHQMGHMYYAVLEGILFNLYQCYKILADLGGAPRQIRISGGIENSPPWLQMAADIFQRDIYPSKVEHASIMGAVALALKALGAIEGLEDFDEKTGQKIMPNEGKAEFYTKRFEQYEKWYKKTSNRGEQIG